MAINRWIILVAQVSLDGFGDSNNTGTLWSNATVNFQNRLYIATTNFANGGEIWQYTGIPVYLPLISR